MDIIGLIQLASVAGFAVLLAWAMVSDARDLLIPNRVSIALAALFLPAALSAGMAWPAIGVQVAVGAGFLVAGFVLFALNIFGGGDAKLLAAVAVWFGWPDAGSFLLLVAVAGGVLALLAMALRKVPRLPTSLARLPWLKPGKDGKAPGLPYGLAIGVAALLMLPRTPLGQVLLAPWLAA